jgi:hypothetical protein
MPTMQRKTLRLHMPRWQGGNLHDYHFGSQLLASLAPPSDGPVETVAVPEPRPGETPDAADWSARKQQNRRRMAAPPGVSKAGFSRMSGHQVISKNSLNLKSSWLSGARPRNPTDIASPRSPVPQV